MWRWKQDEMVGYAGYAWVFAAFGSVWEGVAVVGLIADGDGIRGLERRFISGGGDVGVVVPFEALGCRLAYLARPRITRRWLLY